MSFDKVNKIWRVPSFSKPIFNPDGNLGQVILHLFDINPNKVCQISADTGNEVTCKEMKIRSQRIAENLRRLEYGPGSIIGIVCRNSEHFTPLLLACLLLEAPVTLLDCSHTHVEMSRFAEKVRPDVFFCAAEVLEKVQGVDKELNLAAKFFSIDRKFDGVPFIEDFFAAIGNGMMFVQPLRPDGKSPIAAIVHTSGTTGASKGMCLTHAQFLSNEFVRVNYDNDKFFCFGSFAWFSGCFFAIVALLNCSTRVITAEPETPELFFRIVKKFRINSTFCPPVPLLNITKSSEFDTADLSSIDRWTVGGERLSETLLDKINAKLAPKRIFIVYSCSELGRRTAMDIWRSKPNSAGQIMPGVELKIIDEEGHALDLGKTGEIVVKIQYQFAGYYNDPEKTRETLDEDGWFHTGDMAYLDEEGFLFVVDRKKCLLKHKNYPIWPTELEPEIEALKGVHMACVVGIPHPEDGEIPAALVQLEKGAKVTEQEVIDVIANNFSKGKQLVGGVFFVDEIPLSISKKIARVKSKELAILLYKERKVAKL